MWGNGGDSNIRYVGGRGKFPFNYLKREYITEVKYVFGDPQKYPPQT